MNWQINKNTWLTIGSIVLGVLVLSVILRKPKKMSNMIFVGGLDDRPNDKNLSEQTELIRQGLDQPMSIQSFRYKEKNTVLDALGKNKNSYVFLFSAGCVHSQSVANKMKELGGNLSNIFIIEPYFSEGGSTTKSVRKAVELGVPSKNVFVGKSKATGLGIVSGTSFTPPCSPQHWCSLTQVAKLL